MARRKELRGIAHGLLGSFNSRNNDIDGYWAIGVLYLFASNNDISEVRFDLRPRASLTETSPFGSLVSHYREMLDHLLEIRGMNSMWVKSVGLSVTFNVPFEHEFHYFGSALGGKPYMCTLEIMDDSGHKYSARAGGNCWPHNSKKELRSLRDGQQAHPLPA